MTDKQVQADFTDSNELETEVKLKPLERITLRPQVTPEPSPYLKGKNFSRPWILQDGTEKCDKGSEMRSQYKVPKIWKHDVGIRKRMLKDFFWKQMLDEVINEIKCEQRTTTEYCTEYETQYIRENFEPRNLEVTLDKTLHIKHPLHGIGATPVTYYSETVKKRGPGDILEKFRRTQDFTKPMGERLDNGWVL